METHDEEDVASEYQFPLSINFLLLFRMLLNNYAIRFYHLCNESAFTAYASMLFGLLVCVIPLLAFHRDLPNLVDTPLHRSIILSTSTGFRDTAIIAFAVTFPIFVDSILDMFGELVLVWRNYFFHSWHHEAPSMYGTEGSKRTVLESVGDAAGVESISRKSLGRTKSVDEGGSRQRSQSNSPYSSSTASSSSTDFNTVERVAFIAGILSQPLVAFLPRSDILSNQFICLNYAQNILVGGGMCAYLSRCNKAYWAPTEMAFIVIIFGVAEICGVMRYTVGYDPVTHKGIEILGGVEAVLTATAVFILLRCFLKWLFYKHIKHIYGRVVEQYPVLLFVNRSAHSLMRRIRRSLRFLRVCFPRIRIRKRNQHNLTTTKQHDDEVDQVEETSSGNKEGSGGGRGRDPMGTLGPTIRRSGVFEDSGQGSDQIIASEALPAEIRHDMMLKRNGGEKSFAASGGGQKIAPMLFLFVFSLFIAFFVYRSCKFPSITLFNDEAVVFSNVIAITYAIMMLMVSIRVGKAESNFLLNSLESRRSFVRYISHELRTPLSIVGLGLDLMHQQQSIDSSSVNDYQALMAESREQIEIMQESCTAAVAILNSLLQYESLSTGEQIHLSIMPNCAVDFVREALRPAFVMAAHKGVTLDFLIGNPATASAGLTDSDEDQASINDALVEIDKTEMAHALLNIVSHAISSTPVQGTVTVRLRFAGQYEECTNYRRGRGRYTAKIVGLLSPSSHRRSRNHHHSKLARGVRNSLSLSHHSEEPSRESRSSLRSCLSSNHRGGSFLDGSMMMVGSVDEAMKKSGSGEQFHDIAQRLEDGSPVEGGVGGVAAVGAVGAVGARGSTRNRSSVKSSLLSSMRSRSGTGGMRASMLFNKGRKAIKGLRETAPRLVIEIVDGGPGYSPDEFRAVLKRTFRFNPNDLQGGGRDSGLGMLMAKGIIRSHGGQLWMRSEGLGKGTSYSVYLRTCGSKESNDTAMAYDGFPGGQCDDDPSTVLASQPPLIKEEDAAVDNEDRDDEQSSPPYGNISGPSGMPIATSDVASQSDKDSNNENSQLNARRTAKEYGRRPRWMVSESIISSDPSSAVLTSDQLPDSVKAAAVSDETRSIYAVKGELSPSASAADRSSVSAASNMDHSDLTLLSGSKPMKEEVAHTGTDVPSPSPHLLPPIPTTRDSLSVAGSVASSNAGQCNRSANSGYTGGGAKEGKGNGSTPPLHVLVVDDSALVRRMICRVLASSFKATTDEAENGQQAIDMIRKKLAELRPSNPSCKVAADGSTDMSGSSQKVGTFPSFRGFFRPQNQMRQRSFQQSQSRREDAVSSMYGPQGSESNDDIATATAESEAHLASSKQRTQGVDISSAGSGKDRGLRESILKKIIAADREGGFVTLESQELNSAQHRHSIVLSSGVSTQSTAHKQKQNQQHQSKAPKVEEEPWCGFDLIMCDNVMPVMDGPTAVAFIREQLGLKRLPIFGVTGNVLQSDVDFFISKGANLVLPKPLQINDLRCAITKYCTPRPALNSSNRVESRRKSATRTPANATSVHAPEVGTNGEAAVGTANRCNASETTFGALVASVHTLLPIPKCITEEGESDLIGTASITCSPKTSFVGSCRSSKRNNILPLRSHSGLDGNEDVAMDPLSGVNTPYCAMGNEMRGGGSKISGIPFLLNSDSGQLLGAETRESLFNRNQLPCLDSKTENIPRPLPGADAVGNIVANAPILHNPPPTRLPSRSFFGGERAAKVHCDVPASFDDA